MTTEKKSGARKVGHLSFTRGALETLQAHLTDEVAVRRHERKERGTPHPAALVKFVTDELDDPRHQEVRERVRQHKWRVDKRLMQTLLAHEGAVPVHKSTKAAEISFTDGARATLVEYMTEQAAIRNFERKEHGADPIDAPEAFFSDEIREPFHRDIRDRVHRNKNRVDKRAMLAWMKENNVQHSDLYSTGKHTTKR